MNEMVRDARPGGRVHRDRIDGVLLLDKPAGPTSNDALQRVRRLFAAAKAGHGGTLDPMATGLLPVAFGEATKFLHDLLEADKSYAAVVQLGVETDSGDAEGKVVARGRVEADDDTIRAACAAFVGPIDQVPPMHSALKRDGRPLYELARAGVSLELAPRRVTVHALCVEAIERGAPQGPRIRLAVRVSKGTYVRALARDIGERLGCGGHLAALRRTGVGTLRVDRAHRLEALEAMTLQQRRALLAPVDALLSGLARVELDAPQAVRFLHGQRIPLGDALPPAARVRVYQAGQLLGVAQCVAPGVLAPLRLVAQPQPSRDRGNHAGNT
jgi:tRNA pseudouridine55 synthase